MSSTQSRQAVFSAALALSVASVGAVFYFQRKNEKQRLQKHNTSTSKTADDGEKEAPAVARATTHSNGTTSHESPPVMEINMQSMPQQEEPQFARILTPGTITIAHGSVTGTCAKMAQQLHDTLRDLATTRPIQIGRLEDWDWWDELLNDEEESSATSLKTALLADPVLLILVPTHHGGAWPSSSTCLETALQDLKNDWRIDKFPLKKLQVAVMGMGCSDYDDDTMGKPAKEAFQQFRQLGATMYGKKVRVGDDATGNQDRVLQAWIHHDILPKLLAQDGDDEEDAMEESEPVIMDMEDMGASMEPKKDNEDEDDDEGAVTTKSSEPREMVTASQAAALKKEGYKLIGTHSAVKLCRWTKHQLRGRGGCYKHTFYGITSYQCMEATPSLACANKCVFCWRHHKNPVAKEWKWKTDDPYEIVDLAVKTHIQMIKETKGIPGVNMERWKEAHTVRHCALSLVGEPIMYPRIDELLGDLHSRHISTFLVTNGQHPKSISSIRPITQLYVSVDAPTPETLIEIDRPLFSDAWERLRESLSLLKDKGQRTVARLTVVKGWNSDEVGGYAKLIALGKVSLVEIKGVTFCGKSDASNLNMSNSPWHHEVVELTKNLKKALDKLRLEGGPDAPPEYDLACEHKHSVSVLLARVDQFTDIAEDGSRRWRTWINYPKFHELAARHQEDPSCTFEVQDYTAVTPSWALFGSEEEGFDPTDMRHRKKTKHPRYTQYDDRGIPTHDHENKELSPQERASLSAMMDEKTKQIGRGSVVTEFKGGEKVVQDASLMFRGLLAPVQNE
jgi:tRNA wybutosine-synthesizing protein 1